MKRLDATSLQEQSDLNLDKTYQIFCILKLPFEFLAQHTFFHLGFLFIVYLPLKITKKWKITVRKTHLPECEFSIHLEIFYRLTECPQISPPASVTDRVLSWREKKR